MSATWLYPPTQHSISSAERDLAKDSVFMLYKRWSKDPSAKKVDSVSQEGSPVHRVQNSNSNTTSTLLSKSMQFFASIANPPSVAISNTPKSAVEVELDSYATNGISFGQPTPATLSDPRKMWNLKTVRDKYPLLSVIAQDIFAIRASSAPV